MVRITSCFVVIAPILILNLFVSIIAAADGTAPATQASRGPVTADEASRILLTRDNWRDVENRLGDVYEKASVANQRDQAMDAFNEVMKRADKEVDSAKREALREKARNDLSTQASALLNTANGVTDESVKNETLAATLEMEYRANDYAGAIKTGEPLLKQLANGPLKSATYYYLIRSHQGKLEKDAASQLLTQFKQDMGAAEMQYYVPVPPFGRLRSAIGQFSLAQNMDDQLLMLKDDPEIAAKLIQLRDKATQMGLRLAEPPRKLQNSTID